MNNYLGFHAKTQCGRMGLCVMAYHVGGGLMSIALICIHVSHFLYAHVP